MVDETRAIAWETPLEQIPQLRAELRVGARYVLQADVSAHYASIYTHAIPWALHGKVTAKLDRGTQKSSSGGPPLLGNVLDIASRNIQSGQTIGIPIGPDTSLPLGEAILTEVDKRVDAVLRCKAFAFRFVDDYEFAFTRLEDAERARNVLQDALAEYELQLNPRKTRIIELPGALDTPWAQDLASFALGSPKEVVLRSQLIRYFSKAFELANAFPGDPILKYAVRRLSEVDTRSVSPLLQQLLFQSAVADAGTLHSALYVTWLHKNAGRPIATDAMTRALEAIIARHAPLNHGGDVAWALWGAVVFGLKIGDPAVAALEAMADPIAIVMTLFGESKGVFTRALNKSQWSAYAQPAELFDSRWLVAYEAHGKGWLPQVATDPASTDPFFADARKLGVTFINSSRAHEIPKPSDLGEYS